jgi:hypothetical protein
MAAEAGVALGVPFIGSETGRRADERGGQVVAGVGLTDFNGETFSRLDSTPRGAKPEGWSQEREWTCRGAETGTESAWRGGSHRDGGGGWMTEAGRRGVN